MERFATTPADVIDAFGGPTEFAKIIGKNPSTASEMKRSGAIKAAYWPALVAEATARNIPGITYESLTLMHVKSTTPSPERASV